MERQLKQPLLMVIVLNFANRCFVKKFAVGGKTAIKTIDANIGLKLLNLLELTFVFRNVLVFCHFFLEKKVTKNSRLCRNPCFEYLKRPL
jgi:hypothetical protein